MASAARPELFRRPAFWCVFAAASALALAVARQLFPAAIPLVNLDIRLSRSEALARAEAIGSRQKLAPDGARSAVRFRHDAATQNYVELEGGGKPAFAALVAGDIYAPYWWEVRLFKPGEIAEATLRFRPDGRVYGFNAKVPESWVPADPAHLALDADAARSIAEAAARTEWGVDFSAYKLLEKTQEKRTSGRVDHGFVYEREGGNIGQSHFRLRLEVAGDRLTGVAPFVEIPESFARRYVELRSANNTVAGAADLAAGVLYGLGGCILGVLWLLRKRWLLWKPALAAGLIVGGLMGAMALSSTPSAWFGFDTAQSIDVFWARQVGSALLIVVGGGLGYALAFMAAESLSRRAFGEHPQLWRVWSSAAAPTKQILGRTLGGYLFVPLELALIAAFYYASNRWLGWWQPSEALTDPNILGSAVPALSPIALALQAGFMEECVFRAIPLSIAAIIGARFGRRRLALGVAVLVQALVFGGAHANYPGFPAYSRLVELIVPSILWALIFLRFGLVPTILLHALFDLTLMSIPVFLVDAPGGALQRALVIAAGLVPLAVVLARRAKATAWRELAPALRNGAWQPAAMGAQPAEAAPAPAIAAGWIAAFQRLLPLLGVAGLIAWIAFTPLHADVPPLPQDRVQAIAAADAALAARGVVLGPQWRRSAAPKLSIEEGAQGTWHKYVWRVAGPEVYRRLVGTVLAPPLWEVRYARFEGDVAERAEEWDVTINPDGSPRVVRHTLPEGRPGASLSREDARSIAERELRRRFGLDPATLKDVGAEEKRRPARTDWTFAYAEPGIDLGPGGEARLLVNIAGDEVASSGRYVHVPEAWLRAEREREGRLTILKFVLGSVFALLTLAAAVMAVLDWTRRRADRHTLIFVSCIVFAAAALGVLNRWPLIAMNLSTAEPVASQVSIVVLGALFGGLLAALASGLVAGVALWGACRRSFAVPGMRLPPWLAGVAATLFASGVTAAVSALAPQMLPRWPSHEIDAAWWPSLAALLAGVQVLMSIVAALFLLQWLARVTVEFTRRRCLLFALLVLAAAGATLLRGTGPLEAALVGIIEGSLVYVSVFALFRFDARSVPAFVAGAAALQIVESAALLATPAAWIEAALSGAAAFAAAWFVTRYLEAAAAAGAASPVAG